MNPKDRAGAKKPNLSVLPFAPLLDAIPALYEGRRKYGPWNWRAEEVSETIYADAAIRHLIQFIAGEDIDPDSGVHHISKAIAGLLVVRDAQIHGCSIDDRYVNQDLQIDKQVAQLAGVNERYPEPVPSTLPPRGEEAEVSGIVKYSDTDAGDGSYAITLADVGKTVVLRDGTVAKIEEVTEDTIWPVCYCFGESGSDTCNVHGWRSTYISDADDTRSDFHVADLDEIISDEDIVRVYHQGTP